MADAVTSQTLFDGDKHVVMKEDGGREKIIKVKKKVDPIFELESTALKDRDQAFQEAAAEIEKMEKKLEVSP